MSVAEPFIALGAAGNGFPWCLANSPPAGASEFISGNLAQMMNIYWNLKHLHVSGSVSLSWDVRTSTSPLEYNDSDSGLYEFSFDMFDTVGLESPPPRGRVCGAYLDFSERANFTSNGGVGYLGNRQKFSFHPSYLMESIPGTYDLFGVSSINVNMLEMGFGSDRTSGSFTSADVAIIGTRPVSPAADWYFFSLDHGDFGGMNFPVRVFSRAPGFPYVLTSATIHQWDWTPVFWDY